MHIMQRLYISRMWIPLLWFEIALKFDTNLTWNRYLLIILKGNCKTTYYWKAEIENVTKLVSGEQMKMCLERLLSEYWRRSEQLKKTLERDPAYRSKWNVFSRDRELVFVSCFSHIYDKVYHKFMFRWILANGYNHVFITSSKLK